MQLVYLNIIMLCSLGWLAAVRCVLDRPHHMEMPMHHPTRRMRRKEMFVAEMIDNALMTKKRLMTCTSMMMMMMQPVRLHPRHN